MGAMKGAQKTRNEMLHDILDELKRISQRIDCLEKIAVIRNKEFPRAAKPDLKLPDFFVDFSNVQPTANAG